MLQKYWSKKNKKGFTLVELMVVVAIIAILIAIAIPIYNTITENAQKTACQANQRTIDSAIMQVFAATGKWVTTDLVDDMTVAGGANFGSTTTVGPFLKAKDIICPGADGEQYEVNAANEAVCKNEKHHRDAAST